MVSAVGAAGKIADTVGKGSGVLGRIADYWGLGRALDRRLRSKDIDAAVARYESLYEADMPDELKDLVYAKYLTEARKLDNLTEVLSIVRDARQRKEEAGTMPQKDWLDAFEDGASHAYDDEVRALWAHLLTGEIDKPGSFSKRAIRILRDMSIHEATLFRRLCSWCIEAYSPSSKEWIPMPVTAPWISTTNADALTMSDIRELEHVGVVDRQIPGGRTKLFLKPHSTTSIRINGVPSGVNNDCDVLLCYIPEIEMTSIGIELSKLCSLGNAETDFVSTIKTMLTTSVRSMMGRM